MQNIRVDDHGRAMATDTSTAAIEQLKKHLRMPPCPVPESSLKMLHDAALDDTGASQACRSFLFWLGGGKDPTGYAGSGGLELRRMDGDLKDASIEVLTWWAGPTHSDAPLHDVLRSIRSRLESGTAANPVRS